MSIADRWLLPDGVEEVLPPEAARLEGVRRRLLDLFASWGFELVMTPMVEFLESLLTGTGKDLDLKTFKVTDQVTGRMMGIRADITPQVARMDAHSLKREGVVRLCYAGTVVHAKADDMLASRTPITVGAELFGDTGAAGDAEIVGLMIEAIRQEGIAPIHVELGDVGIFRELMRGANVAGLDAERLFELIQRKSTAELVGLLEEIGLPRTIAARVASLPDLFGGEEVLATAREVFAGDAGIIKRIDSLALVATHLSARYPDLDIYYDLSELRGYNYHTGIVFAAYIASAGQRLAKGGRYDDVGEVFGRARAATGFDVDLKVLAANSRIEGEPAMRVQAPTVHDEVLWKYIQELRQQGYVVIETAGTGDFDSQIVFKDSRWQLAATGN